MSGLALAAWGGLSLRFDFTPQRIFESDDADYAELRQVTETFGRDDTLLVIVASVETGDVFQRERVDYLRSLHAALGRVEGVRAVRDFTAAPVVRPGSFLPSLLVPPEADQPALDEARELALGHPLLAGRLIARDAQAALLV
ncbi:MAG: hypothetical protein R3F62_25035, partial [Planctomycetota bacterium]